MRSDFSLNSLEGFDASIFFFELFFANRDLDRHLPIGRDYIGTLIQ